MKTDYKILPSVTATALFLIIIFSITIFIIHDKYNNNVCSRIDILPAKNYNGTHLGGYSCFIKGDRIDVWFNPIGDNNCLG